MALRALRRNVILGHAGERRRPADFSQQPVEFFRRLMAKNVHIN
jgi:hypothetical protein